MDSTDPYVRGWLATSLGAPAPGRTRVASLNLRDGGLSIRRGELGSRHPQAWRRDLDALETDPAIARLAGVTQVVPRPGPQASRLDHSLEVAVVAAEIAENLGLSSDLAAAIGMAHDCGHMPFGHAGERTFQTHCPGHAHGPWGADVVLAAGGYSIELRAGVRSHSWSSAPCGTPEAEIIRWADRIAYLTRDFADAVTLGLVRKTDLPHAVGSVLGDAVAEQRTQLISAVISASQRTHRVSMEGAEADALAAFRRYNSEAVYQHRTVLAHNHSAGETMSELIATLYNDTRSWHLTASMLTEMTDRQAEDTVAGQRPAAA